jgi:DNA-binding NarL/FixJ family response regulator
MPEKKMVLKQLRNLLKRISVKLLVLSSHDDLRIIRSNEISSSGYLTKKCAAENIVEAYLVLLR